MGWRERARPRGRKKKATEFSCLSLFSPAHTTHRFSLILSRFPSWHPTPHKGEWENHKGEKQAQTRFGACARRREKRKERGLKRGRGRERGAFVCSLPPSHHPSRSILSKGGGRVFCAERAPCFSAQLAAVGDLDGRRRFTRPRPVPLHLLDDIHPFRHRAEDDVLAVQPLRLDGAQEELGACGERKEGRGGGGGGGRERKRG